MGKFGYGEENDRGERLINFCLTNNLMIMNTVFKQTRAKRKWTWQSPDGKVKNMIDFILVSRRWKSSITTCRSFSKPDIASDHQLVMAGIKIKLKSQQRKIHNKRFDMEKFKVGAIIEQYSGVLEDKWANKTKVQAASVEELWKNIKEAYTETAEEVIGYRSKVKRAPWITQEVLNMSDQRAQIKAVKAVSEEYRKQYNKLTKEIHQKVKECKVKWLEDKCKEVEECNRWNNTQKLFRTVKEISGEFQAKLSTVKDENGKKLDNKEEIRNRWKRHFDSLYNEQNPVDVTVLTELPATNKQEHMENILKEEVVDAIRHLKYKKAPGEDNITAEMVRFGGECSVKMMNALCQKIWEEKQCDTPQMHRFTNDKQIVRSI